MPICVSHKRLDEIDEELKGNKPGCSSIGTAKELMAIIAELRRCRKLLSKVRPSNEVHVVTCYTEGCEECGNEYHVVGVFTSPKTAEEIGRKHEKAGTHLHYCSTSVTKVVVEE